MSVEVERLSIQDVIFIKPKRISDSRGYFMETYNRQTFSDIGISCEFVQDNLSLSIRRGTIRGMHFQTPPEAQNKLVRVLQGSIFDVCVDLRRRSFSYGSLCTATLTAEGGEQLFVPAGFAHGFCTLESNTEVAYKVDRFYSRACDAGICWYDPDLCIPWPVEAANVTVSMKDAALPRFNTFESPFEI